MHTYDHHIRQQQQQQQRQVFTEAHQERGGHQNEPRSGQPPADQKNINMDVVVEDGAQMVTGQDYTNYDRMLVQHMDTMELVKIIAT